MLTHEELIEILDYCSWSGLFKWKVNRNNNVKKGMFAGGKDIKRGYIKLTIVLKDGKKHTYLAHRLAWFYVYGVWPTKDVDHKDGIKHHNWLDNLREATDQENNRNKGVMKSSATGLKGVNPGKNGKFRSYICLGTFNTKEEAAEAYRQAALKLHGEFAHFSLTSVNKVA